MGITGELVRSVFSKTRSIKTHEINVKNNVMQKKRWRSSVKAYLCGDEFINSVVAEEDSTSVKSEEYIQSQETTINGSSQQYENHFSHKLVDENAAAIIIQSAFRGFMVRCVRESCAGVNHEFLKAAMESPSRESLATSIQVQTGNNSIGVDSVQEEECPSVSNKLHHKPKTPVFEPKVRCVRIMREPSGVNHEFLKAEMESPSRESLATSIQVQTGNSIGVDSVQEEECPSVSNKFHHKPKTPVFEPKEEWDDSTVNNSISKKRIQSRLEAMNRREKALAYAFSQQLRICSKKKQTRGNESEPNMGWSWLERWMATRQPEGSTVEEHVSKQLSDLATTMKTRAIVKKKFLDLSFEEKESCGSNEVPVQIHGSLNTETQDKDGYKSARINRLKATRNISRRKTLPTYHYHKEQAKGSKRDGLRDKRQKMKQLGTEREAYFTRGLM